jgi:hypothetical protein
MSATAASGAIKAIRASYCARHVDPQGVRSGYSGAFVEQCLVLRIF